MGGKIQGRKEINRLTASFLFYYVPLFFFFFFFPERLPLLQLVRNITFLDVSEGFL